METLQSAKTWLWLNHEFIIAKFRLKLKKVGKTTRPFNQFSHSVVYDSLWSRGLQHTRLPCPSPTHGAYSKSCPSSWWCHPTISSSVIPFSFCLQSFPHQNLFQWVSSLYQVAKVLELQLQHRPSNEYSGLIPFRIHWLDLLEVQGTLRSLLQHHSLKACPTFLMVQLSHTYMTTGKTIAFTRWNFVAKWCLCFLICCLGLSQVSFQEASVFYFHGCSHHLQWFWSPRKKVCRCFHCFPICLPWSDGTRCHDLRSLNVEFWVSFFTLLFHFQELLQFLFASPCKGGVICVSNWAPLVVQMVKSVPAVGERQILSLV